MKKLIIVICLLLFSPNLYALEIVCIVGSRYPSQLSANHGKGWRDGEIVDMRPSGFHTGRMARKHFCVIDFPNIDYWVLRGDADWKSTKASVLELKKFLSKADSTGKYKWEAGYNENDVVTSRRDFFIDYQDLLNKGFLTQAQYDSIYNKDNDHLPISFPDLSIITKLNEERTKTRLNEK